ncbi:MAG TPA: nicotinamide riboside transporter PnuC [Steroidobacteraceae bacterium]|nr:nicotinamide riboside transporter PnuC [Steroidobacteraceae bacterium]
MIHLLADQLASAWRTASWIEVGGAVLAIVYLLLAIWQWRSCWIAAFVSSCLYVYVMFRARLYMESVLNGFYAAIAVYGWWQWSRRSSAAGGGVQRWPIRWHVLGLLGIVACSLCSAYFLRRYTPAAWPFVDSMVTWSSAFATYLVAIKVYENWHWWLVIDSVALFVYFRRELYPTMLLFGVYLVMIFFGIREWRRSLPQAGYAGA